MYEQAAMVASVLETAATFVDSRGLWSLTEAERQRLYTEAKRTLPTDLPPAAYERAVKRLAEILEI